MKKFEEIVEQIGEPIAKGSHHGGIIISESGRKFFLKSGSINSQAYRCEANGLKELTKSGEIEIVEVAAVGDNYILTNYIEEGKREPNFFENFGRAFAKMHRTKAEKFGFYQDNFIGDNPQPNIATESESTNWSEFFFNKRLLYQFRMAEENGYISKLTAEQFAALESNLPSLLEGTEEEPSLLHGDLWSGNFISTPKGNAILIDPAVYYGHREADIAMTYLFGGFSNEFYNTYNAEYPLAEGWVRRVDLYKLYHLLNHLNLFGRGYLGRCEAIIGRYAI